MILLDTHALLWMANDPKRLSKRAHEAIRKARQGTGVAVAAITLWEIAWLAHHQRIVTMGSVESFVRETVARVILRPVTPAIAALAVGLPDPFPRDPSDRLIAATAMVEGMPLVTADTRIRQSKLVETVW
ncbi:MAG TPA: type II toxin-antitoxin system VapC family toxin [Candidatus Dormibacteraeota bacterium]|nr:type II toxin-antitoxin system VapC family toxin [Candidatus Dormibacteraeota bacterium]